MKTLTILAVSAALCICGCSYVDPTFVRSTTAKDTLPNAVKESFFRLHPGSTIEKVETLSFEGSIQDYRISFRTSAGSGGKEVFSGAGEQETSDAFPSDDYGPN
jgi:hypothetical protein